MGQSLEQPEKDSSRPEQNASFGHLLLVWFLVGSSFWTLGFALVDAVQPPLGLSRMGAGLLFGTVVVAGLWSAGWHPSPSASAGYFVAESVVGLLLFLGLAPMFTHNLTPWLTVGLHGTSIALAAALAFTNPGEQVQQRLWQRIRSLVKLPPED